MRQWLSRMPILDRFLSPEQGDEADPSGESPHSPQLNAALRMNERLEADLQSVRDESSKLQKQLQECTQEREALQKQQQELDRSLGDPERAHSVVVYYQLRELWTTLHREIRDLARRLAEKMEREERESLLAQFRQDQERRAKSLRQEREQVEQELRGLWEKRRDLEREQRRAHRIWHYFRRQRLGEQMEELDDAMAPVEAQMKDLSERLQELEERPPPQYQGLSVEARRQINLAMISLAQYFYLQMREEDLMDVLAGAVRKDVASVHYGPPEDCVQMSQKIGGASQRLKQDPRRHEKVRRRAAYLAGKVRYATAESAIPEERSLAHVDPVVGGDEGHLDSAGYQPLPVNVLESDYWGLRGLLY